MEFSAHLSRRKCHHKPIRVGKGVLVGLRGEFHDPADFDLNLFLDWSYLPEQVYGMGESKTLFYPLSDGRAPTAPAQFKHLIEGIRTRLRAGETVGVSCIGGHGRTGTVLGCIIPQNPKPVQWIRQNYCSDAIETWAQEAFVNEHHGLEPPEIWITCSSCWKRVHEWTTEEVHKGYKRNICLKCAEEKSWELSLGLSLEK